MRFPRPVFAVLQAEAVTDQHGLTAPSQVRPANGPYPALGLAMRWGGACGPDLFMLEFALAPCAEANAPYSTSRGKLLRLYPWRLASLFVPRADIATSPQ